MSNYDERVNDEADEHAQMMKEAQRFHQEMLDADPFYRSRQKAIEKKRNQGRQQ